MIDIDYGILAVGFFGGLWVGVFATTVGLESKMNDLKDEACKRGHASWVVVDHKTGQSEFQWNAEPNEKGTK